ncbi:hypothetical protein [Halorussus halobius]|nr:hypothetical protein [Halorussus halobius]
MAVRLPDAGGDRHTCEFCDAHAASTLALGCIPLARRGRAYRWELD